MIEAFDFFLVAVPPILVFVLYKWLRHNEWFNENIVDEIAPPSDEAVIVNLEQSRNTAEKRVQQNKTAAKRQLDTAEQILQSIQRGRK